MARKKAVASPEIAGAMERLGEALGVTEEEYGPEELRAW